jgi:hypothetical protein
VSGPVLPAVTLARLLATLQARGVAFALGPRGGLRFGPGVGARDRSIIAANRAACIALLGLAPAAEGESTGSTWGEPLRRPVEHVEPGNFRPWTPDSGSAESFGAGHPQLGQDFTFAHLFPKKVRR